MKLQFSKSLYPIFVFSLFLISFQYLVCIDIGSDSAPSRFDVQQYLGNGDRIAGFAAINAGFKLLGASVTATFDSFFPVSGDLELNCGTLSLNTDLVFSDTAQISSLGNITGNDHALETCSSMIRFPSNEMINCCYIPESILDSKSFSYVVQTVDWSHDDEFVTYGYSNGSTVYIGVYGFDGTDLSTNPIATTSISSAGRYVTVRWHPSGYFLAVGIGRSSTVDTIRIFEFDPVAETLIEVSSAPGSPYVLAVSWHPSGDFLATGEYLGVRNIGLYAIDGSGNINPTPLDSIVFSPSGFIYFEALDWNYNGDFLAAAVYRLSSALVVYDFDEISTTLTEDSSAISGQRGIMVDWNKTDTGILAVGFFSGAECLYIVEHDESSSSINVRTTGGISIRTNALDWSGGCLSVGLQTTSNELRSFEYYYDTQTLYPMSYVDFSSSVNSTRWSYDGKYLATGADTNDLRIYQTDCFCSEAGGITFSDLNIFLNNDITFANCYLKFDGESMICGAGNTLTLAPTCTIFVNPDSSLLFKDIEIHGINNGKIQCSDSLSTISFDDVAWVQDGDFTFTVGKFDVLNEFIIGGDEFVFAYQTDQISTISTTGKMVIDNGMTFSYDPPISSKELLSLHAETSELILNSGTLHATSVGMSLDTGRLIFDRNSSLISEGAIESEGILLKESLDVQWLPAVHSNCSGFIVFE